MKQLTFTFPEDSVTSTGALFWSAPKRFPRPLQFSVEDAGHLHFVIAAAKLLAENYGIPTPDWITSPQALADAINKVIVPDFDPKKDAKYDTDEEATSVSSDLMDDSVDIEQLIERLENCRGQLPSNFRMNPVQFEKVSIMCRYFVYSYLSSYCCLNSHNSRGIKVIEKFAE